MPRAADGTMSLTGTFAIANAIPVSTTINGYISDITTELTDSWSRSGKGAALAHLSMGGFKMTNVGDGVALTDAPSLKQVQNSTVAWADGGGTADAITATYAPAVTAVVEGMRLRVRATAANATTTPTFSPNGLTARTIKKLNGQALIAGDIAGDEHDLDLTYVATGTYWNLNNPASAQTGFAVSATSLAASTTFTLSGDITPAQITSNQDNYAPTGYDTCVEMRLSTDASRDITGIQGGADGRILILTNVGSNEIVLKHDVTSTAANRFHLIGGTDLTIWGGSNASVVLRYDATLSRWAVKANSQVSQMAGSTQMEAASAFYSAVNPSVQHRHPGHPKFWAYVTVSAGTPTVQASYNVTSITDTGVGLLTITIATDFSSANFACVATSGHGTDASNRFVSEDTDLRTAGVVLLRNTNDAGTAVDPAQWSAMGLGDQ